MVSKSGNVYEGNGCTYDGVDSGRSHRSSLPDSVREILLLTLEKVRHRDIHS